jgi:integrase/recombinase XerD
LPIIDRTRHRSRIRAKINSNRLYCSAMDSYSRQLIREHLVAYLGEAEPPIPYEQEYIDYLDIECGNQPRSIEAYLIDLRVFFRYLRNKHYGESPVDPSGIGHEQIREFLDYMVAERKNGPRARNRKLASIRNYFNFLVLDGLLKFKRNPARRIKNAREPVTIPVILSLEEAKVLVKAARLYAFRPYRDHAIMQLFLQTGLRLDELTRLEREDIKLEEEYVRVRGKGDKERLVPLTETTIKALQTHLERMLPASPDNKKVFLNHHGRPVTRRGVQMIFERICNAAGLIKKGLSPHKLRHTCLTLLYREGVDLMTLKELAGHEDIGSTEIYAHVDMSDVRKAVEKHPLG